MRSTICRSSQCICVFVILAASCMMGCRDQSMNPPGVEKSVKQPAAAKPVKVVISGDTRGWLIPCGCTANQSGGLLRRASYVKQLSQSSNVIVLDCGGAADGTAPYQQARFKAILLGEKQMGLQAHNLGASEVALGIDTLRLLEKESGVHFVSANIRSQDGQSSFATHKLIEQSGQRLLVTGVCSPSLLRESDLAESGLVASQPGDAILEVLKKVAGKFDRLIVLSWLPVDELRELAEQLPEADAVVGGPTGQSLVPEVIGRVLLTSPANKGKFIASLTLPASLHDAITAEIVELSPTFADDESQKANLEIFRGMLRQRDFTAAESGFTSASMAGLTTTASVAGTDTCRECHTEACLSWETSRHSHAWEQLVEQKWEVDPYCQQCHTTGYGLPGGFASLSRSAALTNVGCESCHGESAAHAADSKQRTPVDAIGSCVRCHDHENSPHFEFDEYWEKIHHE